MVENAFGRLKGRWLILNSARISDPDYMADVIVACCILHNVCQQMNDMPDTSWWDSRFARPPERAASAAGARPAPFRAPPPVAVPRQRSNPDVVRDALAAYMHQHHRVG